MGQPINMAATEVHHWQALCYGSCQKFSSGSLCAVGQSINMVLVNQVASSGLVNQGLPWAGGQWTIIKLELLHLFQNMCTYLYDSTLYSGNVVQYLNNSKSHRRECGTLPLQWHVAKMGMWYITLTAENHTKGDVVHYLYNGKLQTRMWYITLTTASRTDGDVVSQASSFSSLHSKVCTTSTGIISR